MREVDELVLNLRIELGKTEPNNKFQVAINSIAEFYMSNFNVSSIEIAILLVNKQKTVLSFAYPPYLVDSGMIPTNLNEAIASRIFESGKGVIDNNFQHQRHLSIFERIKTPDNQIMPIWKMIAARISQSDDLLGIVEISKRSVSFAQAGEDFAISDLHFLEESLVKIAPIIKEFMPDDFKGKFK